MDVPKKYWWTVAIAVPVIVAVIGIIPTLIPQGSDGKTIYVDVVGTQFNGKVAFNDVTVVSQQTKEQVGTDLPKEVLETLQKALQLAQDNKFNEAIPAFESVTKVAPVPAAYNNLGAAYLAVGNKEKAKDVFNKALSGTTEQQTVHFNLKQTNPVVMSTVHARDEVKKGVDAELEPNNEILNPNVISLETWIKAAKADKKDRDYFRFTTPPVYRDIIQVSIENSSTTLKPGLRIFNSEKSDISDWQGNTTAGSNLKYTFSAGPNESFYVLISSYHETSGIYKLRVMPLRAYDDYEPNDTILNAKPITIGKSINAGKMDQFDNDYYQFKTSSGAGTITVFIKNLSTTLKPGLRIFNSEKSDISDWQGKTTGGANLNYSFASKPDSVYYILVSSYHNTSGNYALTVKEGTK